MNTDLTWGNCTIFNVTDVANPNLSCGYYQVPMDYFDPTAGKARLAVIKYGATVPEKKGTLFVNPGTISAGSTITLLHREFVGGPGGSGIEFMNVFGDLASKETQGQYDIVSWDPRGVGTYTL